MIKRMALMCAVIGGTVTAPAVAKVDWFAGAGVALQEDVFRFRDLDFRHRDSASLAFLLRTGLYLNDNNRIYANYSINTDSQPRSEYLLGSYDYLFNLDNAGQFFWFVGASAGYNHFSLDGRERFDDEGDPVDPSNVRQNRFAAGVQTGFNFRVTQNVSTEVGYRFLETFGGRVHDRIRDRRDRRNLSSHQLYLGLDLRF